MLRHNTDDEGSDDDCSRDLIPGLNNRLGNFFCIFRSRFGCIRASTTGKEERCGDGNRNPSGKFHFLFHSLYSVCSY